jgi:hypothetical protein
MALYGGVGSMTEHSDSSSSTESGVSGVALYGGMASATTEHSETSTESIIQHGPDAGRGGEAYGGPPVEDFCDTGCGGLPDDALA